MNEAVASRDILLRSAAAQFHLPSDLTEALENASEMSSTLLDSLRQEFKKAVQEKESNFQHIKRENDSELTRVKNQAERAKITTAKLDAIRVEVATAETAVEELDRSTELSDTRDRLTGLVTERREIDRALNTVDRSRHLEALEQVFGDTAVPPVLTETIIETELARAQDRTRLPGLQTNRLRAQFMNRLNSLDQAVRETRKRLTKAGNDQSVLETSTKYTRSQLQDKQNQLRQMEERILSVAGSPDLEQVLGRLQQRRQVLEE
ncbi:unnamed protein product [Echinostoma caproni]|uniref:Uncharacterized protein n=1 Tax=Echinostoma caproni TaxID=27848 RepID=A0A3P8L8Z2_9TREM|nr:unnamed protein product [Echinostoma caproni]